MVFNKSFENKVLYFFSLRHFEEWRAEDIIKNNKNRPAKAIFFHNLNWYFTLDCKLSLDKKALLQIFFGM